MKTVFNLFFALVLISSCNFKSAVPKTPAELRNISYSSSGDLDQGVFDSTTYQNSYFGFSIANPEKSWMVLNQEQYDERIQNNIDDKKKLGFSDSTLNKTRSNVHNLFTITKNSLDSSSAGSYKSISFMAEGLDKIPGVTNALEYVNYSAKYTQDMLSRNFPKYKIVLVDTGMVGNRIFLRTKMEIEAAPEIYFYQNVYTAQFGKYILNVIANFKTPQDYADVLDVLSTVKWK